MKGGGRPLSPHRGRTAPPGLPARGRGRSLHGGDKWGTNGGQTGTPEAEQLGKGVLSGILGCSMHPRAPGSPVWQSRGIAAYCVNAIFRTSFAL